MRWVTSISLLLMVAGCTSGGGLSATTQPVTYQNLATTQPSYWLNQPTVASASATDFARLWAAAEQVSRNFLFRLDRQDYRSGVLTTIPLVSAQWFEPWRQDVYTAHDRLESSLATIRRTIEFDFTNNFDGTYTATPKVLIERASIAEIRITSVTSYSRVFNPAPKPKDVASGTSESDQGINLVQRYWFATGRDLKFEAVLADAVKDELRTP